MTLIKESGRTLMKEKKTGKKEYLQVFTTVEKKSDAVKIADTLVKKRVAGCVQILGPIKSTYWWKGSIEKTQEWLCIIKTQKFHYNEVENIIKKIHPYEVPEILAIPVVAGSKDYLKWLDNELII